MRIFQTQNYKIKEALLLSGVNGDALSRTISIAVVMFPCVPSFFDEALMSLIWQEALFHRAVLPHAGDPGVEDWELVIGEKGSNFWRRGKGV